MSRNFEREKKTYYIPRYRFQPWIDTPSLIDFSRAHLWRDWRWSRASLPSKRCQSPGETFFFSRTTYQRTLYRTVVASCLINLFYLCHTRVHGSNFGSRDRAKEDTGNEKGPIRAWNARIWNELLSYFLSNFFFFFSNFPTVESRARWIWITFTEARFDK